MAEVAVVYLARKPNDPRFARAFLDSLIRHPAGADYRLVYALKGYGEGETDPDLEARRTSLPCAVETCRYDDKLMPFEVCFDALRNCTEEKILLLVSWSRILAPNWLRSYLQAFDRIPSCGIVGATGSYEATHGCAFPNIGIRANAFMVPRTVMSSLDTGDLSTRDGALLFEAGPNGMTKQFMRRGLRPVVVDRFGRAWSEEDWPRSLTFRAGQQEGLLIADNRTFHYQAAHLRKRRRLATRCWGTADGALAAPPLGRFVTSYRWFYPGGLSDLIRTPLGWGSKGVLSLSNRGIVHV